MQPYSVGRPGEPAHVREAVVAAVLDVVRPRVRSAVVSAHVDGDLGELPLEAEQARRRLTGDGTSVRARTRLVRLDLADVQDGDTLRDVAPWSSSVELEDEQGEQVASLVDGWPVVVVLTATDAERLAQRLGGVAEVVEAEHALRRLRQERRGALRRLLRLLLRRRARPT